MKAFFRKLAHVKKRRIVKKAIGLGVTAWTFKFGAMNSDTLPTRVDSGHYTQRLETQYSYKKTETDDQSVNSSRFKTGSGAVIEIQNQQNQTPEALKSALEIRCGDLGKSGPGPKAKADARRAKTKPGGSGFAEAWVQNPSNRARPAAANRLVQQLQPGQAEGGNGLFGRFSARPTPEPSNPRCAGGPRSITVLSGQRNANSSTEHSIREITAYDEVKGRLTDKSANHLTSKHAHDFGIDDPLPPLPNQKPGKYPKIRTRINKDNKKQFTDTLEKILQDPNTEVFPGVSIRGIKGQGYYTEDYGQSGFFVGITTEGELAGQITKAQLVSDKQLKTLQKLNKID